MANARTRTQNNTLLWSGFALCVLYFSYRYPLKINSSDTSPTYTDTPLIFQVGKYALALPLIAVASYRWFTRMISVPRWPVVFAACYMTLFAVVKLFSSFDSPYIEFFFWFFFSLILALAVESVSVASIDKFFLILFIFGAVSDLIQVLLYAIFGRLPALAYEGTFMIRFGGFLDDPNGFAAILFLLLGWANERFKKRRRILVLATLTICLILTQSWTAMAFFFAVSGLYILVKAFKRPLTAAIACCLLPVVGLVVWELIPLIQVGFMLEMLQTKQGSIEDHIFPWSEWTPKWLNWAFFGDSQYTGYESWWASALVNFGSIWLAVFLVVVLALLFWVWRDYARGPAESKPVYAGLLLFGFYFVLASFNLPFPIIFPINALFFLFFFLAAFDKIAVGGSGRGNQGVPLTGAEAKATGK